MAAGATGGVAVLVVLLVVIVRAGGGNAAPPPSPTPGLLAPVSASATGSPIDAIQCETAEANTFHVHAHLAVYVRGAIRRIPQGIGIAPPRTETPTDAGPYVTEGTCFYWLHTHTDDGIVHVEAPAQQAFTLGEFFDIWGQQLTDSQVAQASGAVMAYVDGQRYTGAVRDIPLGAHTVIQLDVGTDVAPKPFQFPAGY